MLRYLFSNYRFSVFNLFVLSILFQAMASEVIKRLRGIDYKKNQHFDLWIKKNIIYCRKYEEFKIVMYILKYLFCYYNLRFVLYFYNTDKIYNIYNIVSIFSYLNWSDIHIYETWKYSRVIYYYVRCIIVTL